jgi:DNA ligase-1
MKTGDKSLRKKIETAYNVLSDIGEIAERVKGEKDLTALEKVHSKPGVPVRTSLAERLPSAEKIIEKVGPKVAIEPKMDGFRVQLHIVAHSASGHAPTAGREKKIAIFSRNHENVTAMFPEIAEAAKKLPVKQAIFDGEAIGYNPETQQFALFQQTVQRKRKHNIDEKSKEIPLKVFVFDILNLDGVDVMSKPFSERRRLLEDIFGKKVGTFVLTRQVIVDNAQDLRRTFDEYLAEGLEGIMAKKQDAPYQAGGRGFHWVKFKKHSDGGLSDTID